MNKDKKITISEVDSIIYKGINHVIIKLSNGLMGIGSSSCWAYPGATHAVINKFKGYLLGQNPFEIEHHWQYLYRMGPFRGSILSGAISAIDIALWDLKGKHYDLPVWKLLGGPTRKKIRLHLLLGINPFKNSLSDLPDHISQKAKEAKENGFTALKIDPLPQGYESMTLSRLIDLTKKNVRGLREGAGLDVDIILELHRKLTPMVSIALAKELYEFHPLFIEDPVQIDSIVSQGEIAGRTENPLANGERMHNIWEFRELFQSGGSQYARPDMGLAGGITQVKKIASIAESYHSALVTHNFVTPVTTAAACNIDASIPNFLTQEYTLADESEENKIFGSNWKRVGGFLELPETPGIGLSVDFEKLLKVSSDSLDKGKNLFDGENDLGNIPIRNDGSVGYSV